MFYSPAASYHSFLYGKDPGPSLMTYLSVLTASRRCARLALGGHVRPSIKRRQLNPAQDMYAGTIEHNRSTRPPKLAHLQFQRHMPMLTLQQVSSRGSSDIQCGDIMLGCYQSGRVSFCEVLKCLYGDELQCIGFMVAGYCSFLAWEGLANSTRTTSSPTPIRHDWSPCCCQYLILSIGGLESQIRPSIRGWTASLAQFLAPRRDLQNTDILDYK